MITVSLIYVMESSVARMVESFFVVEEVGSHLLCLFYGTHCRLVLMVEELSTAPVKGFGKRHCRPVLNWSESMIVEEI